MGPVPKQLTTAKQAIKCRGRLFVQGRGYVTVEVCCDRDGGVPEAVRDNLQMYATSEHERRMGVPEAVKGQI